MKMKRRRWLWLLIALVIPVGYAGLAMTGSLEPPGTPAPTMRTLEELQPSWSKKINDASKRFEIVWVSLLGGSAVLDKETGLVWEQSPDTTLMTWDGAIGYAYRKNVGGRGGWRLPTIEELRSLVDPTQNNPALPSGHPFTNVQTFYWSSTSYNVNNITGAWGVLFQLNGDASAAGKTQNAYVWCVRGGQAYDAR